MTYRKIFSSELQYSFIVFKNWRFGLFEVPNLNTSKNHFLLWNWPNLRFWEFRSSYRNTEIDFHHNFSSPFFRCAFLSFIYSKLYFDFFSISGVCLMANNLKNTSVHSCKLVAKTQKENQPLCQQSIDTFLFFLFNS